MDYPYENKTYKNVKLSQICGIVEMVLKLKDQLVEQFPDRAEEVYKTGYWAETIENIGKVACNFEEVE